MNRQERRSRREARRANRRAQPVQALKPLINVLPPAEVLAPENLTKIHQASMRLLKDTGMLIIDYPNQHDVHTH